MAEAAVVAVVAIADEFVVSAAVVADGASVVAAEAVVASSEDSVGPMTISPTALASGAQPASSGATHLDVVSKWRSSGQWAFQAQVLFAEQMMNLVEFVGSQA